MTRRMKILVGVVVLVALVLVGSAIAQATSSHEPQQQQVRVGHPAASLHTKMRAATRSALVEESHSRALHALAQKADDDVELDEDQPEADEPAAPQDDVSQADDDHSTAGNEQADEDDQGEHQNATVDDDDDDQSADVDDDEADQPADNADDDQKDGD